ncbi:hypothetical protein PQU92_07765 [Asticcacaulis sp. BYS171W]|uniref:Uncharacterized protein n=1 Tax=Asticcacaulis aquaticus TaxID=2984212 RepID=A0ABT5HT52_9CAUL|nr:hypothetical protein [Asticcacaulis aquaticus]MDC7683169.1 hypothetical protein [Asticcacaulis aquaticus]
MILLSLGVQSLTQRLNADRVRVTPVRDTGRFASKENSAQIGSPIADNHR